MMAMFTLLTLATAQQRVDPFAGSGCNCSTFCAGSCSINASRKQNITLYRMTPDKVYDMVNKDTGDVLGDTSFVISKRTSAYECKTSLKGSPFCSQVTQFSGDDQNSTDRILAFTIEVDGQWGPYLPCNPDNASRPLGSWHCSTDVIAPPKGWPQTCDADHITGFDQICLRGKADKIHNNVTLAECCDLTSGGFHVLPQAFSYHHGNSSCEIRPFSMNFEPCPMGVSGFSSTSKANATKPCNCSRVHTTVGRQNLSTAYGPSHGGGGKYGPSYKGGLWYSNPAAGQCKEGEAVGDNGCTWRVVGIQKAMNATCMYNNIDAYVEVSDATCFGACPQPKNVTSECYLKCYSDATNRMTEAEITVPWDKAFASDDVTKGGCPSITV
jgi:hypothetical protein